MFCGLECQGGHWGTNSIFGAVYAEIYVAEQQSQSDFSLFSSIQLRDTQPLISRLCEGYIDMSC